MITKYNVDYVSDKEAVEKVLGKEDIDFCIDFSSLYQLSRAAQVVHVLNQCQSLSQWFTRDAGGYAPLRQGDVFGTWSLLPHCFRERDLLPFSELVVAHPIEI